jgi:hypothetical protein
MYQPGVLLLHISPGRTIRHDQQRFVVHWIVTPPQPRKECALVDSLSATRGVACRTEAAARSRTLCLLPPGYQSPAISPATTFVV